MELKKNMFQRIGNNLDLLFHHCFMRDKNITFSFEAKYLLSGKDVLIKNNRYYLPLYKMMNKLGGKARLKSGIISLLLNKKEFQQDINSIRYLYLGRAIYISLFDITKLLGLRTRWSHEKNEIRMYWDRDTEVKVICPVKGSPALIRFEDITADPQFISSENLEKLRIISDYMYSKSIPFHISWIPRYVDPPHKIDNDPSYTYSMENADFIFTLDHMLWKGGLIGIHGYTHQCGMEVTAEGTEFSYSCNNDERKIRKRIEFAICAAKRLALPVTFFESPHYASTEFQQSIEEQYFDYIYEPYVGIWGDEIVVSPRNKKTVYVPTPLGYVTSKDTAGVMILKIKGLPKDIIASLFYHPYLEMDFINLSSGEKGYPMHSYSKASTLHRIIDSLLQNGRKPIKITEVPKPIKRFSL